MNDIVFITGYTDKSAYEVCAQNQLIPSFRKFGLNYDCFIRNNYGNWLDNVFDKAYIIKEASLKYPDKDLVWIDADAEIIKDPVLFNDLDCDVAAHYADEPYRLMGGTLFFRKGNQRNKIIDRWLEIIESDANNGTRLDQKLLEFACSSLEIKVYNLPKAYCCKKNWVKYLGNESPVILHGVFSSDNNFKENIRARNESLLFRNDHVLVVLANKCYLEYAKQVFASAFINGKWRQDFCLIAHNIPETLLIDFYKKGIFVINTGDLHKDITVTRSKVNLTKHIAFSPFFKRWKRVVLLDADIIVRNTIAELPYCINDGEIGGVVHNSCLKFNYLSNLRDLETPLGKQFLKEVSIEKKLVNGGCYVFDTSFITYELYGDFIKFTEKYMDVYRGEQVATNSFFQDRIVEIDSKYNVQLSNWDGIKPAHILHFPGAGKCWAPNNDFYNEWYENYKYFDKIDFAKRKVNRKEVQSKDPDRLIEFSEDIENLTITFKVKKRVYIYSKCQDIINLINEKKEPSAYLCVRGDDPINHKLQFGFYDQDKGSWCTSHSPLVFSFLDDTVYVFSIKKDGEDFHFELKDYNNEPVTSWKMNCGTIKYSHIFLGNISDLSKIDNIRILSIQKGKIYV